MFAADEGGDSIVTVTELPETFLQQASCDTTRITNATPVVPANPAPEDAVKVVIRQPLSVALNYYAGAPIPYQGEVITNAAGIPEYQWDFGAGAQLSASNTVDIRAGEVRYGSVGERTIGLTVRLNGRDYRAQPVTITVIERNTGPK